MSMAATRPETSVTDAAVKARLRSLPEAGDQRRSSKFWLNNSSPAAQVWEGNIKAAIAKVEELGQNTSSLWPLGVQETFSYLGMEPQLLTTLFGDPNRHSLRVFSRFPSSPPSSWISDRHIDWDLPFHLEEITHLALLRITKTRDGFEYRFSCWTRGSDCYPPEEDNPELKWRRQGQLWATSTLPNKLSLDIVRAQLAVLAVHSSWFILNLCDTSAANSMAIASVKVICVL
ncbi:hypothetical protein K443DRAFT_120407 [Laccaria amethystina LaAM-08-1]|uniref:Ig-like domain-containing protein n=1 Tax=Laccaria amethystina LaAM-08-1 TaxID=1095629 RepID=A0A0C9XW97_9AGAR|nr:hypothetical protein K443DRAFT_120407 [Laccaria amethystina LaAM-08-1]